ncbi:MAG: hypothetical protein K1X74_05165 [Pirellulales bacterium]|nr:hypothetical protein [Pirellulales bacterium]
MTRWGRQAPGSNRAMLVLAATACMGFPARVEAQSPPVVWQAHRNRLLSEQRPRVRQEFGYRDSQFAGGHAPGEIGGTIQRSPTPASYAAEVPPCSLQERLQASGRLVVRAAEGGSGAMLGWFNATASRGWRTPHSLGLRVDGNGGKYWLFYEYGTGDWQTGGGGAFEGERYQTTPTPPFAADGTSHRWRLEFDPRGDDEPGRLTFQVDERRYEIAVPVEHKRAATRFDRFGFWNVQIAGAPLELYVDDLEVNGRGWDFAADPQWIGQGNRAEFAERVIRPLHDYGAAPGAAGLAADAWGGIVFRDEQPSYFGQNVAVASLDEELYAAGRLSLVSAASDSGVYLGWFDAAAKRANLVPEHEARQPSLLALLIEGPSRVGHYVRPAVSAGDRTGRTADGSDGWPIVRPDGRIHIWQQHYVPDVDAAGGGVFTLRFDDLQRSFLVTGDERRRGARFDTFGLFNLQSGGHHVEIYVDQLRLGRAASDR